MTLASLSADIRQFLRLLYLKRVKYLIVGGEAVIYYGHARLTGDIDIFYNRSASNCHRLYQALKEFWGGKVPFLKKADELRQEGLVVQFGAPPNRIDLLSSISGVDFAEAWKEKREVVVGKKNSFFVFYIGLQQLIKNKQITGRPRDLEDLEYLLRIK